MVIVLVHKIAWEPTRGIYSLKHNDIKIPYYLYTQLPSREPLHYNCYRLALQYLRVAEKVQNAIFKIICMKIRKKFNIHKPQLLQFYMIIILYIHICFLHYNILFAIHMQQIGHLHFIVPWRIILLGIWFRVKFNKY